MGAVVWIVLAVLVLSAFVSDSKGKGRKKAAPRGKPALIEHPHYLKEDDYECSACGARFRKEGASCPGCGARFEEKRVDDGEFLEEMELWDGDEE